MSARSLLLLPLLVGAVSCARPVAVQSDPGTTYAIEVVNRTAATLQVSFEAAAGTRELGSVAAGATERFVVVSPGGPSITVLGAAPGFTVRQPVTLRAGETVRVVLSR